MATAPPSTPDPMFEVAFKNLKDSVTPADATAFQSTTFEEVWKAAEDIEKAHRERRSLRNMARIAPFLHCLENYSKIVEVLCNGTPYLPWIWAPIKLMVQLADQYTSVFDKLLDAYRQIGEVMPQFGRLQATFQDDPNFKVVLGMVYSDILEFHQRAYKFFRRRSWHIFFDSLWKSFDFRFQGILKRLARHQELLMKQVVTIDVVEARQWRIKSDEEIKRQEKKSQDFFLHDSFSWLNAADYEHDDELERLSGKRQEGTCEWVFRNSLFQTWKDDAHGEPILWVKGIPGAGKTILSTFVIGKLQEEGGFTTAYHICNSYTTGKNLLGEILRSITVQFLRSNLDLAPYIFDNYANKGLAPSIVRLRKLLPEILQTIQTVRIIIDGLDEYPESDQRLVLDELLSLSKGSGGQCRVLFSNREGTQINKILNLKPTISLRDQHADVEKDIQVYVRASLYGFRASFGGTLIDDIENRIVAKSNGMFLWVRLVLNGLENCSSPRELLDTVDALPEGLDKAYGRILEAIDARNSETAIRILQWIACSFRILKTHEIQDGIVLQTPGSVLNEDSKLVDGFWEQCKPLIEKGPKNTIDFVHYSAKEYVLHMTSGPFLDYFDTHYGLASSSMNYMNSSTGFIDEKSSETDLRVRVVKGLHGLHRYANEYWFQHLLQYAKGGYIANDVQLEEPLEDIRMFWKNDPGTCIRSLKLDDTTSADGIAGQLEVLASVPLAQQMGLDILTFRKFLSQEKYSHEEPDSLKSDELKYDPTRFSEISQRYQGIVRSLIECPDDDPPEGTQQHELQKFKLTYVDSAFICRYRECPRYSDGFKSSAERDEHERIHAKPLRCADPACEFFARGFTSKTGLQKHNKKYHPAPDEVEPPAFEPRREPEPEYVPSPAPAPPVIQPPRIPTPPPPEEVEEQEQEPERNLAKRGRVSRAKKGLRVHNCNLCPKVFTRAEGLRRHKLSHGDPKFPCSWDGCGRAFYRPDLLDRHVIRHKTIAGSSQPSNGQSM